MKKKKNTAKQLLIISILLIFSITINSQSPIKKVATSEIESALNNNGIDSAMTFCSKWPYIPLYKVDSALYLKMINFIDDYSSEYAYFIFNGANNIQNPLLAEKTFELFKEHTSKLKDAAIKSKYKKVGRIDTTDLSALVKQKNDSIESFLKNEYDFWKNATEVRKKEDSHYNCLVIMLALNRLNSSYYSETAESFHRENVGKWSKDTTLEGNKLIYGYKEYETSIINLKNEYEDLAEINFEDEPELANMTGDYPDNEKCWKTLIYNNEKGILDVGCQFSGLSGYGNAFLIELVEKNKLKVSVLKSWIS